MTGRWERCRNNSGVVERERKNVVGGFSWCPLWYRLGSVQLWGSTGKTKDEECSGGLICVRCRDESTVDGSSSCRPWARKESAESQDIDSNYSLWFISVVLEGEVEKGRLRLTSKNGHWTAKKHTTMLIQELYIQKFSNVVCRFSEALLVTLWIIFFTSVLIFLSFVRTDKDTVLHPWRC